MLLGQLLLKKIDDTYIVIEVCTLMAVSDTVVDYWWV